MVKVTVETAGRLFVFDEGEVSRVEYSVYYNSQYADVVITLCVPRDKAWAMRAPNEVVPAKPTEIVPPALPALPPGPDARYRG